MLVSRDNLFFEDVGILLENNRCCSVIGRASCYSDVIEKLNEWFPDVIIIDVSKPVTGCARLIKAIKENIKSTHILMAGTPENSRVIFNGLKAGATGFISTDDLIHLLPSAVMHAYHGRNFLSPPITTMMVKRYLEYNSLNQEDPYNKLTNREKEILQLIGEGYGSRIIANRLNISMRTVSGHRWKINRKLDIHTAVGLIKYAISKQSTSNDN